MRLDSANRSFLTLLGVAAVLYVGLATAACALLSLLLYRLATEGTQTFSDAGWAVVPAALFLGINAAGPVLGLRSLGHQIASSRRLRRRVARLSRRLPEQVGALARGVRLRGLRVIDSREPFSFAYGAWRPRVVVSQGLVDCASEDELRAVLIHERYHVRNLDPLKVVVARAVAATFFLIPALRALERRYVAGRELAADRRAARACGRHSLASALLKVVRGPEWPELGNAAAIGGPELLDARVAQLESGREPSTPLSRTTVVLSALTLILLAASFFTAVVGLGGLSAAFGVSDEQLDASGLGAVVSFGCAIPVLMGAWLVWTWHRA